MIDQTKMKNLAQKLETLTKLSACICIPAINPDNDDDYELTSSDIKNIEYQLAVMDEIACTFEDFSKEIACTFEDFSKEIASTSLQMKIILNMIKIERGDI